MTAAAPATATALTAEHLVGLWLPAEPDVSPDGRLVAFRLHAVFRPKKRKQPRSAIWLAPADASAPARRWTAGDAHDRSPRYSPDGRRLAFLSDRAEEGTAQLYVMPTDGGEADPLTHWRGGVERFAWSPDGRTLAFVAGDESGDDPEVWGARLPFHRLRLLPAAGGEARALTPADRHVTAEAWSPDGRALAVALTLRPDEDAPAE